jgi:hypothetical protein
MTHQTINNQTDRVLHPMSEAFDICQRACAATIDLNVALAQQGWRSTAVAPYLGFQIMQRLFGLSLQFPLYGMRVWHSYLQQANVPQQQPIVTVGPNTSFYFRGPENRLNSPAANLAEFLRLGQEIDDAIWQYHLRRGDYTHWFHIVLQDEELAATAAQLEHADLSANESRTRMQDLIEQRYALPA